MMILIFTTGGQRCSNLMFISLKMDRWLWLMIRSQKSIPKFFTSCSFSRTYSV